MKVSAEAWEPNKPQKAVRRAAKRAQQSFRSWRHPLAKSGAFLHLLLHGYAFIEPAKLKLLLLIRADLIPEDWTDAEWMKRLLQISPCATARQFGLDER